MQYRGKDRFLSALGASLLMAGILSFVFGACVLEGEIMIQVAGIGTARWSAVQYCALGALLASLGTGGLVWGLLARTRE